MTKSKITIEVSDIKAIRGYFSFEYEININDKLHKKSTYKGMHTWLNDDEYKKVLENGQAIELAIEKI